MNNKHFYFIYGHNSTVASLFVLQKNCCLHCGLTGYDFASSAPGKLPSFVNMEVPLLHFNNGGSGIRNHILRHSALTAIAISSIAPKELKKQTIKSV